MNTTTTAPKPGKIDLRAIKKCKVEIPKRIVIYGPPGVGKSQWAADAPNPIFLSTEDGTAHLHTSRWPFEIKTWQNNMDAIRSLQNDEHDFKTLVQDSLDWLEPMNHAEICRREGKQSIEDCCGGFAKGYAAAIDLWRIYMNEIEILQKNRKMDVICVCHSKIITVNNVRGDNYDMRELKLYSSSKGTNSAAALFSEWCRDLFFADAEILTTKESKNKFAKAKGISDDKIYLYTRRTAGYYAKNSHNLPDRLPLQWSEFESACNGSEERIDALISGIREKVAGTEIAPKTETFIAKAGRDLTKLSQLNSLVNAKLSELSIPQTTENNNGGS